MRKLILFLFVICVAFAGTAYADTPKFSVTTTNLNAGDVVGFSMSAAGMFYIDCGDGGTLYGTGVSGNTVDRTGNTTFNGYECHYSTGGVKTIGFNGTATAYNSSNASWGNEYSAIDFINNQYVASLHGDLSALFPYLGSGFSQFPQYKYSFYGCRNLISIPATLFQGYTTGAYQMFPTMFMGCSALQSIPDGLFANITTGSYGTFHRMFEGCTSLTSLPSGLFKKISNTAGEMLSGTFGGCTNLTTIPPDLFGGITGGDVAMFSGTFRDCTSLTSIPGNLFAGVTSGADYMFYDTFSGCTNLSGYIPPSTFAGLIANNHPTASSMWNNTFANTALATSCPNNMQQYITGYESEWAGKVSCGCAAGYINSGASCEPEKFSITTTNDTSNFIFSMTAKGTFYVDWGDGTVDTITRTNTNATEYAHSYSSVGSYTVRFGGVANEYGNSWTASVISFYKETGGTQDKIATVSGSFENIFPQFGSARYQYPTFYITFRDAVNLTSIPANLFRGLSGGNEMFSRTFLGCSRLQSIPSGLFDDINVAANWMFEYTFSGCSSITSIPNNLFVNVPGGALGMFYKTFGETGISAIPSGLFNSITTGADYLFSETFYACTSLETIPSGLFSHITNGAPYMFNGTFYGCTDLTTIPSGLFANITTGGEHMFSETFYGCTSLVNIPSNLFAGITIGTERLFSYTFADCTNLRTLPNRLFANITTGANMMFASTFYNDTSLTSIPSDLFAGMTTGASSLFRGMFRECSSLTGYVPPDLFRGLSGQDYYMWMSETFYNTNMYTSCPNNMQQYITGFESYWDGKVSCYCPSGGLYNDTCHARCPYGDGELHVGQYTHPLWADITNVPSPSVYIGELGPNHDGLCYAYLEPDDTPVDNHHGFHTVHNGVPYHAINLGLYGLE